MPLCLAGHHWFIVWCGQPAA